MLDEDTSLEERAQSLEEVRDPTSLPPAEVVTEQPPIKESSIEKPQTSYQAFIADKNKSMERYAASFQSQYDTLPLNNSPVEASISRVYGAAFKQSWLGRWLYGYSLDANDMDIDFNVKEHAPKEMLLKYPALYALANNSEVADRLTQSLYQDEEDLAVLADNPWKAMLAQFLLPQEQALGFGAYNLARAATLPVLSRLASFATSVESVPIRAAMNPRVVSGLREAVLGAETGAAMAAIEEPFKRAVDDTYHAQDLMMKSLHEALWGAALGGALGALFPGKVEKIKKDAIEVYEIQKEAQGSAKIAMEDFVGPPERVPPKIEPDLGLRALDMESIKALTDEEIASIGSEEGLQARSTLYQRLRDYFNPVGAKILKGETGYKNIDRALKLLSGPLRNMSAGNRALTSAFGTIKLYTQSIVYNGWELQGTREGMVMPRNAQLYIEHLLTMGSQLKVALHEIWLKSNGIEQGAFATEKANFGSKIWDQENFYSAVSEAMLYVDTPYEGKMSFNEHVLQGARYAWENVYKPVGDILKDINILDKNAKPKDILNYLNREYSLDKIYSDPDGFVRWAQGVFTDLNEQLKTMLPNYRAAKEYARGVKRMADVFERAAEKMANLGGENQKQRLKKLAELETNKTKKEESIKNKFEAKIKSIKEKYDRLRSIGSTDVPDIKTTRKIIRETIKDAHKELDKLTAEYDREINSVRKTVDNVRNKRNQEIRDIRRGAKDSLIKKEFRDAQIEDLTSQGIDLDLPENMAFVDEMIDEMHPDTLHELRADYINLKRSLANSELDSLKADLKAWSDAKKQGLSSSKKFYNKDLKEAVKLLEEESKVTGKSKTTQKVNKLLDIREKLEEKLVSLQRDFNLFKVDSSYQEQAKNLIKDEKALEFMRKKYGMQGYQFTLMEQSQIKRIKETPGLTESEVDARIKEVKKRTRELIKQAVPDDEAKAIAQSLLEGYKTELENAESLISDDFRGKDGKPRRTWSVEQEPETALNLARKLFDTVQGMKDEVVSNPLFSALSANRGARVFKARQLPIPDNYPGLANWTERNIGILANNFMRGVAPAIALTKVMHELNKMPIIQQTVKRMQIASKSIGPEKAKTLPTTMQHYSEIPAVFATMAREEYKILAKGLEGKELKDLNAQYNQVEADLVTMWDTVTGLMGNRMSINSAKMAEVVGLGNSQASTVTNNNLSISLISDLFSSLFNYSLKDWFNNLRQFSTDAGLRELNKKELADVGLGLSVALGTVTEARYSGSMHSLKNTPIGKGITGLATRIGNFTGANKFYDFIEVANGALIKSKLLETAEKAANKTLSADDKIMLSQNGLSEEQAVNIFNLWKKHGWEKGRSRGLDPDNVPELNGVDLQAYGDYHYFIKNVSLKINVKPGAGSLPDSAYTVFGRAVLFLKKWFFAVTNDTLFPALQRSDQEAAQGALFMLATGVLQSEIRRTARGEERKEFDMESFIVDTLSNSAVFGVYGMPILDLGTASGIFATNGGARYDPMNGVASWIMGPGIIGTSQRSLNVLGRLSQMARNDDRVFSYKDLDYTFSTAVPLWRFAPIHGLLAPRIKDYMESTGR